MAPDGLAPVDEQSCLSATCKSNVKVRGGIELIFQEVLKCKRERMANC